MWVDGRCMTAIVLRRRMLARSVHRRCLSPLQSTAARSVNLFSSALLPSSALSPLLFCPLPSFHPFSKFSAIVRLPRTLVISERRDAQAGEANAQSAHRGERQR
eukprot:3201261-Pleurochrysis_carterae.AAC.1